MKIGEFDQFATNYDMLLRPVLAVTGEDPEFFHEYKVREVARMAAHRNLNPSCILDFGSGVGNSTPYFARHFPSAQLACTDVSQSSLRIAEESFPGVATLLPIQGDRLPYADDVFDITFSACVFHHIPHEQHIRWLSELRRVTRVGGMLTIFEHNPLNPLTVRAVNTCPFDEDAHLLRAGELKQRCQASGWSNPTANFHLFFPNALSGLRFLEPCFSRLPIGAQYCVSALKLQ